MLIRLLYGENETLLCNTQCATVNLLNYIRQETKLDETVHIDLANESGLVIELGNRVMEHSDQYCGTDRKFILVQRKERDPYDPEFPYCYKPLLKNYEKLYPGIKEFGTEAMLQRRQPAEPSSSRSLAENEKKTRTDGLKKRASRSRTGLSSTCASTLATSARSSRSNVSRKSYRQEGSGKIV